MITFPINPTTGQVYVADNTVTYEWTGDRWSAYASINNGHSFPVVDGLHANSTYNPSVDITLDGGTA